MKGLDVGPATLGRAWTELLPLALKPPLTVADGEVDRVFLVSYIPRMPWEVEATDEFAKWWDGLTESEQIDVEASVRLVEQFGPTLRFPYSSGIEGSKHGHMRELRVQHAGRPYRILYAFDPRQMAILLLGGDKTGCALVREARSDRRPAL